MFTLPASIRRGARLDALARAVAAASGATRYVYVERRGSLFRWSPAHRGGPYPLLRETAKVLGADYHALVLPCRGLPTTPPTGFDHDGIWQGLCIVAADESVPVGSTDRWAVLEFESATSAEVVRDRIRAALPKATVSRR